jgi:hypothetical protein
MSSWEDSYDELWNEVQALKAELAQPRADRWQPIVTAPRDGSRILLWYPSTREDAGVAAEGFFDVLFDGLFVAEWMVSRGSNHIDRRVRRPTHWMPLPDGPALGVEVIDTLTIAALRRAGEAS